MSPNSAIFSMFIIISYLLVFIKKYPGVHCILCLVFLCETYSKMYQILFTTNGPKLHSDVCLISIHEFSNVIKSHNFEVSRHLSKIWIECKVQDFFSQCQHSSNSNFFIIYHFPTALHLCH